MDASLITKLAQLSADGEQCERTAWPRYRDMQYSDRVAFLSQPYVLWNLATILDLPNKDGVHKDSPFRVGTISAARVEEVWDVVHLFNDSDISTILAAPGAKEALSAGGKALEIVKKGNAIEVNDCVRAAMSKGSTEPSPGEVHAFVPAG